MQKVPVAVYQGRRSDDEKAAQALRHYDEARAAYAVQPGAYEVRVGASSADIRAQGRFTVVPAHD